MRRYFCRFSLTFNPFSRTPLPCYSYLQTTRWGYDRLPPTPVPAMLLIRFLDDVLRYARQPTNKPSQPTNFINQPVSEPTTQPTQQSTNQLSHSSNNLDVLMIDCLKTWFCELQEENGPVFVFVDVDVDVCDGPMTAKSFRLKSGDGARFLHPLSELQVPALTAALIVNTLWRSVRAPAIATSARGAKYEKKKKKGAMMNRTTDLGRGV